ncbi:serine-threonine rich protein [Diplocarpon rosae]|nr:serine-threonine rich protein [Diplocarpon rosae]
MKFPAITALCAAPLALAGSFDADLYARGTVESPLALRKEHLGGSSRGSAGGNGNINVNIGQSTSITEVIIIWINQGGNAQTQTFATTIPVAAMPTAIATHTVIVGGTGGLAYTPDQVNAAVGDMVLFEFHSNNHTATQSAFTTPCDALAGGMDSGFMANVNNTVSPAPQMAMQVTVATPIWFYCRQKGHCGQGMTFSINPTANKTQAMFRQMAIDQGGAAATSVIVGSSSTSTSAAPAASTAAPAASAGASMVGGTGSVNTAGACACSCLCGVAAFPHAAVQGIGAFGGMSGAVPMSALEA